MQSHEQTAPDATAALEAEAPPEHDSIFDETAFDSIDNFIFSLATLCVEKMDALGTVGGNILLQVHDKGTWTLVTSGPNIGLHDKATDDVVDFVLICEDWVLYEMLHPEGEPDWQENIECGAMEIQGDPEVFIRLIKLAFEGQNALSIQTMRFAM